MTPSQVADSIYDRVCGTPDDVMLIIDQMIEDCDLSQSFFDTNEIAILSYLDERMFNCYICGWNCEAGDMSYEQSDMTNLVCNQCVDDGE